MEKKEIKISLTTFVVCVIILILLVAIGMMTMYIINQNKTLEESKIEMQNKEKALQNEIQREKETGFVNNSTQQVTNQTQTSVTQTQEQTVKETQTTDNNAVVTNNQQTESLNKRLYIINCI